MTRGPRRQFPPGKTDADLGIRDESGLAAWERGEDPATDPDDLDEAPDDDTAAAVPDLGKRIAPEHFTRPSRAPVRRNPVPQGHQTSSLLSGQREGMRLDFQGPLPPVDGPNFVTARPLNGPLGPIGSSVNENPGNLSVQFSDHRAAAAQTRHAPAVAGVRGARRKAPATAPLSPGNDGPRRAGSPTCQPPPACQ